MMTPAEAAIRVAVAHAKSTRTAVPNTVQLTAATKPKPRTITERVFALRDQVAEIKLGVAQLTAREAKLTARDDAELAKTAAGLQTLGFSQTDAQRIARGRA